VTTTEIGSGEFLRNYDAIVLRDIWYAHVTAERGERTSTKSNDVTNAPSEPFVSRYSAERFP
jgi:hypothetical protein